LLRKEPEMSDPQAEIKAAVEKAADPLQQWRELRDVYMGAWAKSMGEVVNSEAYAQSNGAMLETYLTTSAPFREAQKSIMLSALEQLHMPSQADFISLAERLSNLELLLDDMDAKLTRIHQFVASAALQSAPKAQPAPVPRAEPAPVHKAAPKAEPETKPHPVSAEAEGSPRTKAAPKTESDTKSRKSARTAKKGSR
jgi:hypothetical protein